MGSCALACRSPRSITQLRLWPPSREMPDPSLPATYRPLAADVGQPLPFKGGSFDACYSHMLFNMALSSRELAALDDEIRRVVRPGSPCVYTVRHVGDTHFGAGTAVGDDMYENGGFVAHFFNSDLVARLAKGFELEDITPFEEGGLPRRLWRVTMRVGSSAVGG